MLLLTLEKMFANMQNFYTQNFYLIAYVLPSYVTFNMCAQSCHHVLAHLRSISVYKK